MDKGWINRTALLLEFLAGILLTPELFELVFGLDKIRKWEEDLKGMISKALIRTRASFPAGPRKDRAQWIIDEILTGGIIFIGSLWFWVIIWRLMRYVFGYVFMRMPVFGYLVLVIIFLALNAITILFYFKVVIPKVHQFGFFGMLTIVVMISMVTGLVQVLRAVGLLSLWALLTFARRVLERRGLRAMMLTVGIVAFVARFLLQFLAT